ncbi:MAG: hypothetical protein ABEJ56_01125 [Candidatus Nanohaloarchaea archaeon]
MELGQKLDKIEPASILILFFGLLVGGTAAYLAPDLGSSPSQAATELASTLEKSSGQSYEVVKTEENNGLYRIQLRTQNDQLVTYFMTKDGSQVIPEGGLTDFQQFQRRVSATSEFASCLSSKNVIMFGNISRRATRAQVQLLGGLNTVSPFYADINNNQTLQRAVQAGIRRTPAFVYNGSVQQGVQTRAQLEQFTGCSYNVSG